MRRTGWPFSILVFLLALAPVQGAGEDRNITIRTTTPPASERRAALVIGNATYTAAPTLRNPVNDARAMAQALQGLSFQVSKVENAGREELDKAVNGFVAGLAPGSVGLFYFSGHGIQIEGLNYLLPTDFDAQDEVQAKHRCISADEIRERMESRGTRLNLVILDACRDNPFRASRSSSRGLAMMSSGRGTLVVLATGPGRTADDSPSSKNGLFTQHLLQRLTEPLLEVRDVFNRVIEDVDRASGGRQTPWLASSVVGKFFFVPDPASETQLAGAVPPASPTPATSDQNSLASRPRTTPASSHVDGEVAAPVERQILRWTTSGEGEFVFTIHPTFRTSRS